MVAGDIAPGARLTERRIIEACGCTQALAREILWRLETLGAVQLAQRRGARVISARDAPIVELTRVWRQTIGLLESAAGEPFVPSAVAAPWPRLCEDWKRLEHMGQASGEHRLAALLRQVALQHAIVSRDPR